MVKFVSIFTLRQDVDGDEAYKAWREKHAQWMKEKLLPDMKKYSISRVIRKYPGAGGKGGEFNIFGYEMCTFDNLESALESVKRVQDAGPYEFLAKYVTTPKRVIIEVAKVEL